MVLAACHCLKKENSRVETVSQNKPVVYFTKDISPEGLIKIYDKISQNIDGKVAIKFHTGGPRTGEYILAGEELTLNAKGESIISYADYAIAMVDEAEKGNHIQKRISTLGK